MSGNILSLPNLYRRVTGSRDYSQDVVDIQGIDGCDTARMSFEDCGLIRRIRIPVNDISVIRTGDEFSFCLTRGIWDPFDAVDTVRVTNEGAGDALVLECNEIGEPEGLYLECK